MFIHKSIIAACLISAATIPALAQGTGSTLDKIKETGTITIGYRESSVPFSYLDGDQKPVGFAMDICAKIVDAIKAKPGFESIKVQLNPVTSATRIPLMANGTIDLECGSTTNNPERQQQVAFTNTHYLTASRFVTKKDAGIKTLADLKGKTVVSTAGTANIKQLTQINADKSLGITIVPAKDHAEGFLMMETGRAVAFVMDDVLLAGLVASSREPGAYVISEASLNTPEPYGIMMRKDDADFKALADKATSDLYTSPEMQTLYAKWFQSAIPPKNINLNLQMSEPLKKAFAKPSSSANPSDY